MCTLTYIPLEDGGFLFTTNRDESGERMAEVPANRMYGSNLLLYPQDKKCLGSWIATNGRNLSVCILNGAYKQHKRRSAYRLSRGVVMLELFAYDNVIDYVCDYPFSGIEPFTLVAVEFKEESLIHQIIWDGNSAHYVRFSALKPRIWSSVTLYDIHIRRKRERWFKDWLANTPKRDLYSLLDFHRKAGEGDPNVDLIMNRPGNVKTVSITSLLWSDKSINMYYEDITNGKIYNTEYGTEYS